MRTRVDVEVPATIKKVERTHCDICGSDIDQERLWNRRATCKYYDNAPDFEPSSEEFDFCVNCMKKKVMPLLAITFSIGEIYDSEKR